MSEQTNATRSSNPDLPNPGEMATTADWLLYRWLDLSNRRILCFTNQDGAEENREALHEESYKLLDNPRRDPDLVQRALRDWVQLHMDGDIRDNRAEPFACSNLTELIANTKKHLFAVTSARSLEVADRKRHDQTPLGDALVTLTNRMFRAESRLSGMYLLIAVLLIGFLVLAVAYVKLRHDHTILKQATWGVN